MTFQDIVNETDDFLIVEVGKDFIYNKNIIGIVLSIITISIYAQIPKFANWIIKPDRLKVKS